MSATTPVTTPVTVTQTSKQWTVGLKDLLESLVAAVITPIIPIVVPVLSGGSLTFNKNQIIAAALLGFVLWLGKKFATPSQTVITGTTPGATINVTAPPAGTQTTTTQTK
jgi:hypothetical protein